jgi:uncharacterized protein
LVNVTTYCIAALGVGIGVAVGITGAGSSILTVLLLEHATPLGINAAITTSLAVVALMSVVALVPYVAAHAVLWRAAAAFGVASMTGAYLAGRVSTRIPAPVLLVLFLLAMLIAAGAMLWPHPPAEPRKPPGSVEPAGSAEPRATRQSVPVLAAAGLVVGAMTGLVGLGGGFAVVPLLVVFARVPVRSAVGTSILVIAMNTVAGLAGHFPHPPVDWRIVAYLGAAESAGSLVGAKISGRVSASAIRRGFAAMMLVAAVFMLGKAVLH